MTLLGCQWATQSPRGMCKWAQHPNNIIYFFFISISIMLLIDRHDKNNLFIFLPYIGMFCEWMNHPTFDIFAFPLHHRQTPFIQPEYIYIVHYTHIFCYLCSFIHSVASRSYPDKTSVVRARKITNSHCGSNRSGTPTRCCIASIHHKFIIWQIIIYHKNRHLYVIWNI